MICQSKFAGKLAKILKKPNFQYQYIDTFVLVYCCTKVKLFQISALHRQKWKFRSISGIFNTFFIYSCNFSKWVV